MAGKTKTNGSKEKRVTRYSYDDVMEPRTPETGHTALLPADEQVVNVPMDNGWSKALKIGRLPEGDQRAVVVDMDPAADPTLLWTGKRNRRAVPLLPLQRNEIVSESRIAQIIERARKLAMEKSPQMSFVSIFADLEKTLRESDKSKRIDFYTHEEGWKNKLICGDSLQVMESLLHYEGLRGQVQFIYFDPPYGIDYNSNIQQRVDTAKNSGEEAFDDVLSIKAFNDTWALGIHSYLTYLRDRLYVFRELIAESGSIFFQISDTNVHLARTVLDEVFGRRCFVSQILFRKSGGLTSTRLNSIGDYLLWYCKEPESIYYRQLYQRKKPKSAGATQYRFKLLSDYTVEELTDEELEQLSPQDIIAHDNITSQGNPMYEFEFAGRTFKGTFKPPPHRMKILAKLGRLCIVGNTLRYVRRLSDFPLFEINQLWEDTGVSGFGRKKVYAVQTSDLVVQRCLLMTTKPGDLVLDPTLGSGTTALAAERFGRRWVGIDSSRVSVNVARHEMMSALYKHYKMKGPTLSSDFDYEIEKRITMSSIIDDQEPESVPVYDYPIEQENSVRVTGPFEILTLGRYSVEDWKGSVVTAAADGIEQVKLENYIGVICRLYRKNAAIQGATGLLHAIVESEKDQIALSVGPLSGRVTGKQINDAVQDALASGILEIHILGWAFDANVGEVKAQLEKRGKVKVELVMIRPDTLAEGLKISQPGTLFSPLALPDVEVKTHKNGKEKHVTVILKGVAMFDRARRSTDYRASSSGYISAWYLDEDYDGDCFVDCQMFFDFKKVPNTKTLGVEVDPRELVLQTESHPFPVRSYKRIAVKVVDVFGNESTVVRDL